MPKPACCKRALPRIVLRAFSHASVNATVDLMAFTVRQIAAAVIYSLLLPIHLVGRIEAASSDWLRSPKPKFPQSALKHYSEGSVRLRLILASDGSVREAQIVKSSGDGALDKGAHDAVLKWKLRPAAIRPSDLVKGRDEIIDFKQEAPMAARHPDRWGYFTSPEIHAKIWMFAPFPAYPFHARASHTEGTVFVGITIGPQGEVQDIRLVKSSGSKMLDDAALSGVRLWRAHKQYAGRKLILPVRYVMGR